MVTLTKGYRAALAAAACGAMLIGAAGSASAAVHSAAPVKEVAVVTPAKKADDAAVKAEADAKKAEADAKVAADAAKKAADAVTRAVEKAKALAARQAAADAKKAATAAKKAADAEAKAIEKTKVLAAQKAAAAAKKLAAQKAAEAAKAVRLAASAVKAAEAARNAQVAKEVKIAAAIPGAPVQLMAVRKPTALNDFTVSWGAPTGRVKSYVVTVHADGAKTAYPATTKKLLNITGRTLQTTYRIEVAAKDVNGNGATSTVLLAPATPGEPTGLTTGAISAKAGLTMSWLAPVRTGLSPVDKYRVQLKDLSSGVEVSQEAAQTSALFADADPRHTFEVTITAISQVGDGLPMTTKVGDLTSTIPQGFTAVRDAKSPTEINIAWSPPVWQSFEPVTDYEVGVDGPKDITWISVGLAERVSLSLPLNDRATYYVRAINASGPSPADDASVDLGVKTQLPSSGAPVVLSADDHQVDVALYGWVGDTATDQLVVTVAGVTGDYRREQVTANGKDGVAFRDLVNGVYTVTVVGHDSETGNETAVYDGTITVDNDSGQETSMEASFDAGVGYWRGVYPTRHLPRVTSSKDVSFEGLGSMAITATWDSSRSNISVSTNGFGGIPVKAKQAVTLNALGRAGAVSNWNMGVSWWDASGKQIAIVRAKRIVGVVNTWQPSASTYIAPTGAVTATAFVEIGGMLKGESFNIDGINLQSR